MENRRRCLKNGIPEFLNILFIVGLCLVSKLNSCRSFPSTQCNRIFYNQILTRACVAIVWNYAFLCQKDWYDLKEEARKYMNILIGNIRSKVRSFLKLTKFCTPKVSKTVPKKECMHCLNTFFPVYSSSRYVCKTHISNSVKLLQSVHLYNHIFMWEFSLILIWKPDVPGCNYWAFQFGFCCNI